MARMYVGMLCIELFGLSWISDHWWTSGVRCYEMGCLLAGTIWNACYPNSARSQGPDISSYHQSFVVGRVAVRSFENSAFGAADKSRYNMAKAVGYAGNFLTDEVYQR